MTRRGLWRFRKLRHRSHSGAAAYRPSEWRFPAGRALVHWRTGPAAGSAERRPEPPEPGRGRRSADDSTSDQVPRLRQRLLLHLRRISPGIPSADEQPAPGCEGSAATGRPCTPTRPELLVGHPAGPPLPASGGRVRQALPGRPERAASQRGVGRARRDGHDNSCSPEYPRAAVPFRLAAGPIFLGWSTHLISWTTKPVSWMAVTSVTVAGARGSGCRWMRRAVRRGRTRPGRRWSAPERGSGLRRRRYADARTQPST